MMGVEAGLREKKVLDNLKVFSVCSRPDAWLAVLWGCVSVWRNCQSWGTGPIYRTDPSTKQNLIPKGPTCHRSPHER